MTRRSLMLKRGINANGHTYVDYGLPSGTLWADSLVKDSSNAILYFQWGAKHGYTQTYIQRYTRMTNGTYDKTYSGSATTLPLSNDSVRLYWGGDWRMPTKAQCEELKAQSGVSLLGSGIIKDQDYYSGNYTWTSQTPNANNASPYSAMWNNTPVVQQFAKGYYGMSVRGVIAK